MSDEFDQYDDVFDESFLQHVDALEAAHTQPTSKVTKAVLSKPSRTRTSAVPSRSEPRPQVSFVRSLTVPPAFSAGNRQAQATSVVKPQTNVSTVPAATSSKINVPAFKHNKPVKPPAGPTKPKSPHADNPSSDAYDMSLPLSPSALEQINQIEAIYAKGGTNQPLRQKTLFGGPVPDKPAKPAPAPRAAGMNRVASSHNPFGRQSSRTKQWDRTAFASTGMNKSKGAQRKGKRKTNFRESDEEEEEDVEYEQFPAPFVSLGPSPPMKLKPDLEEAKEWIYPLNRPLRDYQYNIVQAALFRNILCALPTGLGKTFIAGVVMLNYYRWFPEGKVIFVAPTKPLVAQQIEACHETCGIPGEDAVEMTGEVPQAQRERHWRNKRVFYMTPQTLQNDLTKEVLDARDVILLVIDEAHKATGNYAYATVVRYLMAKNPYFRILALTATPGGKPEAVQDIVDSLHIGHIEIRDEQSLDLRDYVHEKHTTIHSVKMDVGITKIKEKLVRLMENTVKPLRGKNIIQEYVNVGELHPYRCQIWIKELRSKPEGRKFPWATGVLMKLGTMCRALGYLMEESVDMCYNTLIEQGAKNTAQKDAENKLAGNADFKAVIAEIESYRVERLTMDGYVGHPKMDLLSSVALAHFTSVDPNEAHSTRVMVFCQFRDCVDEIVKSLNHQEPMIRATRFIGQGTDKRGNKGINQKDQLAVIKRFKDGEYNVLVCTSIGEEGLDIGEVDLIICYDAQKSAIKMLQRVGRTGRKRDGEIAVLVAEGREDQNWESAKDSYSSVQQAIIRGDQLELFDDDERLLPPDIKPQCRQKIMEIKPFVRDTGKKRKSADDEGGKAPKRRKRNDDPARNIPQGAISGFVSAADLIIKGHKGKSKACPPKAFDPGDLEDDEDDLEIEGGLSNPSPIKKASPVKQKRVAPRRPTKSKPQAQEEAGHTWATAGFTRTSDLLQHLEDDSDDMEIEGGLEALVKSSSVSGSASRNGRASDEIIELYSDDSDHPRAKRKTSSKRPSQEGTTHSSPSSPHKMPDHSWLLESDVDVEVTGGADAAFSTPPRQPSKSRTTEQSPLDVGSSPVGQASPHEFSSPARMALHSLSFDASPSSEKGKSLMGAPAVPHRSSPSESSPFPIRRGGARVKRIVATQDSFPASQPEAQEYHSPVSPVRPRKKKGPRPGIMSKPNPFFDVEAALSGSDQGEGGEEDDEGVLSESDRLFLKDSPATQASSVNYDNHAMYMQGLMTQAPGAGGPAFMSGPIRPGRFGGRLAMPRRVAMSSSDRDPNSEPNEYELDSFVVPDNDEMEVEDETGGLDLF